jgi:hypothetical protein
MGARVVTVNEVLGGHVALDIECLDRVYLNAYVPILQSSCQVVAFMTQHLGLPIPSPALLEKISQRFRRSVASFAEASDIAWVKFGKDDRKADVMAPYLKHAASGCVERRVGLCRGRSPGQRRKTCTRPFVRPCSPPRAGSWTSR